MEVALKLHCFLQAFEPFGVAVNIYERQSHAQRTAAFLAIYTAMYFYLQDNIQLECSRLNYSQLQ